VVLAVLFRAGGIVVTHQGRPYRSYQEPSARQPFATTTAFRAASFAPRESIDLKTLTTAVKALEDMIGQEVDVEESAIAEAFKKLARTEKDAVLPALATAQANRLPAAQTLHEWSEQLDAVLAGGSDDCVRMLAGEGKTIRELRDRAGKIRSFLTDGNLETIRNARTAVEQLAPALCSAGQEEKLGAAPAELREILGSAELPERINEAKRLAEATNACYQDFYRSQHRQRFDLYSTAIDDIKGKVEFLQLDQAAQETILQPLQRRAVQECDLPPFGLTARNTRATLGEIRADIEAQPGLQSAAIARMQEILAKASDEKTRVERVRLSSFFTGPKDPTKTEKEQIDEALDRLRERLHSLLDEGVKILWE